MLLKTSSRLYCIGGSASASGGMNLWQRLECDTPPQGSSVLVCAEGAALIALEQVRADVQACPGSCPRWHICRHAPDSVVLSTRLLVGR